ncbi:hypothetical protein [Nonomuraea pusilla]|uniref:hypothetical protein n=1 Tax=Nonomuraea pusilla TaxID=46177 RepID=UPI0015A60493|nr:hypothetical protein [Nonomuraea pusilla]
METGSVRRVLAVKPDGPWLVLVDGTTWNVEPRNTEVDEPLARPAFKSPSTPRNGS